MTLYQFMSDSPWLTLFLVGLVTACAGSVLNRALRAWNINRHGWPPDHCDADGDFRADD